MKYLLDHCYDLKHPVYEQLKSKRIIVDADYEEGGIFSHPGVVTLFSNTLEKCLKSRTLVGEGNKLHKLNDGVLYEILRLTESGGLPRKQLNQCLDDIVGRAITEAYSEKGTLGRQYHRGTD